MELIDEGCDVDHVFSLCIFQEGTRIGAFEACSLVFVVFHLLLFHIVEQLNDIHEPLALALSDEHLALVTRINSVVLGVTLSAGLYLVDQELDPLVV